MGAAHETRTRASLEALVLEVLNGSATPEARDDIIERALEQAGRQQIPDSAAEVVAFVSGPLRTAATTVLGEHEATELLDQLLYLLGRAAQSGAAPNDSVPTLPPPSSGVDESVRDPQKGSAIERRVSPPFMGAELADPPATRGRRRRTAAYAAGVLTSENANPKVVVLDDDPSYRRALSRLLTSSGYEVTSAADVKTAMWMCERLKPDVVVTDYELQESDGLAFAADLARRFGDDTPPVLLVTASTTLPVKTPDVAGAMLKGSDDEALLAKVRELVERRSQRAG